MADRMLTAADAIQRGLDVDPFVFTDVSDRVPELDEDPHRGNKVYLESRWFFVIRTNCLDATGQQIVWLSMRRNDRRPLHDFRHLQRIKNAIVGPDVEAVQIYPREDRLIDESNQTHLWCYPGSIFPVGYIDRSVITATENAALRAAGVSPSSAQRPFDADAEADSRPVDQLLDGFSPLGKVLHRPLDSGE